jgi:Malectin domain
MVSTPTLQSPTRLSVRAALGLSLGLLLSLASGAFAAPLTVAWDAVPGAAGYRLHYGDASRHYTATVDVGPTTMAALSDLDPVGPSYLTVTAYTAGGDESPFSNEILYNPAHPTVVWAVNAGGAKYTDAHGLIYRANTQFTTGRTGTTTAAIAGTTEDGLYQNERWGTFAYAIPVANGNYLVTLKFAEIDWTQPGQRVFNVLFEGVKVLEHLDVVATVGPNAAYDVTLPVRVTDGQLNIAFRPVVDYATVSAIVVRAN